MRPLLIARNELQRRIRNRSAIITAFIGPLALAVVFSVLVAGAEANFTIGVVDRDGSPTTRAIVEGLVAAPPGDGGESGIAFERVADVERARDGVDDGTYAAAVVLPERFEADATAGNAVRIRALRSPDRLVAGQVAAGVATAVADEFDRVGRAVRSALARGTEIDRRSVIAAAREQSAALKLDDVALGGREASAAAFYGASMSILFLFFTVGFAARSVLAERREGTLGRVLATPAGPGAVITGKTAAVCALGTVGLLTVWAVTSAAFGADWGDPVGVLVVILATVLAVGGVATFVASFARTDQQADAYTSIVTFALALLGGNFIGPGQAPDLLRSVSLATPNGWSLRAFTDLSADAGSLASVTEAVLILVAFAVVFGVVGIVRVRRAFA